MPSNLLNTFKANIHIIGINPFVFIPPKILNHIFKEAGRDKGPIPIKGTINGSAYKQTLVRYSNEWRLYINTTMLKNSPKRIGEWVEITIELDNASRDFIAPPGFVKALKENKKAAAVFEKLTPSLKQEIIRYLAKLKTKESLTKNILRAINFLMGKERFAGREIIAKPAAKKLQALDKIANKTGLPENLKSGVENLSGISMDNVIVHYNSDKPAQLNAVAYANGSNIDITADQQKHLPNEPWHVVQQKQGRVKPVTQKPSNLKINKDTALEKETDVMAIKARRTIQQKGKK